MLFSIIAKYGIINNISDEGMVYMTELEKIAYAKMFIDKLANGINPLDDSKIPDGDIVNNVRLSRCFFYVSDILRQVIENGEKQSEPKPKRVPFAITQEQIEKYEFSETPIPVSKITDKINSLIDLKVMKKLSYRQITAWLLNINALCEKENAQGKLVKCPTEFGEEIGISTEFRPGKQGQYTVIVYNKKAQSFILDNIEVIIAFER
ncbi:MAG: hypothetical protein IKK32_07435 [Oscillospiraceae bacterium]|nr:hypothetical protein [Oscillospiraceae bacterium]MBR4093687.1 hypothetical protein [Oscillospiraceae bacterium]